MRQFAEAGHQQIRHITAGHRWITPAEVGAEPEPKDATGTIFKHLEDSPNMCLCGIPGRGRTKGKVSRPLGRGFPKDGYPCPTCVLLLAQETGRPDIAQAMATVMDWVMRQALSIHQSRL